MAQIDWGAFAEEAEKQGGFAPLPIGIYNIKVDTAEVKTAKNEHFSLLTRLVVTDGPLVNKSILNNMTPFKNDGGENGFFTQALAALGFGRETNPGFWQQLQSITDEEQPMLWISQSILGAEATIEVTHRIFNNENRDNVKKMVPKGSKVASGPSTGAGVPPVVGGVPQAPAPPPVAAAPPEAVPTTVVNVAPVPAAVTAAPSPLPTAPPATAPAPVAVPAAVEAVTELEAGGDDTSKPAAPAEAASAPPASTPAQPAPVAPVVAVVPDVAADVPVVPDVPPVLPEGTPF